MATTALSVSAPTAPYFLIAAKDSYGKWIKLGFVRDGARLSLDKALGKSFGKGTRCREELLKACRWMKGEKVTPKYLDVKIKLHSVWDIRISYIKK